MAAPPPETCGGRAGFAPETTANIVVLSTAGSAAQSIRTDASRPSVRHLHLDVLRSVGQLQIELYFVQ